MVPLTENSDSKTLAKGALINFLGIVAKFSRTLFTIIVARLFGAEVLGNFISVTAVVDVASRLALFGMDKSIWKFVPELEETDARGRERIISACSWIGQALSLLAVVVILFAAPWIVAKNPQLATALRIVSLALIPLTMTTILLSATKALKIMTYDVYVNGLLYPFLLLVLAVPVLWFHDKNVGLAMAYSTAAAAALGGSIPFYMRHFSLKGIYRTPTKAAIAKLLRFSTPLGLSDFVQFSTVKIDILILVYFVQPVDVAVYFVAMELAFVVKKFRQIFDPMLVPLLSELHNQKKDLDRVRDNIALVIRWILTIGMFYVGGLFLFNEVILSAWGSIYVAGATCLMILSLAQLLGVNTALIDLVMMVSGRPQMNLLNACILIVLQVGLDLILIPAYGILGAAIGASTSLFLLGMIRIAQGYFLLKLNPFQWKQLKPIGAATVAVSITMLSGGLLEPALGGFRWWIALFVEYLVLFCLGICVLGLEREERKLFNKIFRKTS